MPYRDDDIGFAHSEVVLSEELVVGVDDRRQTADVEVGLVAELGRVFLIGDHHLNLFDEARPDDAFELFPLHQTFDFARVVRRLDPQDHRNRVVLGRVFVGHLHHHSVARR